MTTGRVFSYALVLGVAMLAGPAWALDPVDHQPIAILRDALKNSGQVRIAQGIEDQLAHDTDTGKLFVAKVPLMLTTDSSSGEWTISVLNDRFVGSTLLIGDSLQRPPSNDGIALPTFDRDKATQIMTGLKGFDPAYYPDEIKRVENTFGYTRMFTGKVSATTKSEFKQAMTPSFADVLVNPKTGDFMVLVVDQYGTCGKIAFGGTFSEKP